MTQKIKDTTFMATILVATLFLVLIGTNVHALELLDYKQDNSSGITISLQAFTKSFNSTTPTCLKDGSSMVGVNKAFKNAGMRYRDCSSSGKRAKILKAQGKIVNVFKLGDLSEEAIKAILSK